MTSLSAGLRDLPGRARPRDSPIACGLGMRNIARTPGRRSGRALTRMSRSVLILLIELILLDNLAVPGRMIAGQARIIGPVDGRVTFQRRAAVAVAAVTTRRKIFAAPAELGHVGVVSAGVRSHPVQRTDGAAGVAGELLGGGGGGGGRQGGPSGW